jgi:hypothetical protein
MRWILPGGARLERSDQGRNEQSMACRPLAAVEVRTRPRAVPDLLELLVPELPAQPASIQVNLSPAERDEDRRTTGAAQPERAQPDPSLQTTQRRGKKRRRPSWLITLKRVVEVLAMIVGLITAILALLGLVRN